MIRLVELECPNCGSTITPKKWNTCKCSYCNSTFLIDRSNPVEIKVVPKESRSNGTWIVFLLLIFITMFIGAIISLDSQEKTVTNPPLVEETPEYNTIRSGYFKSFVQSVFGKTVDEVTPEELARIKSIGFIDHIRNHYVDYRIDDKDVARVKVSDEMEYRSSDLRFFTGLEQLDTHGYMIQQGDLAGLKQLRDVSIGNEPKELSVLIPYPTNITKLKLSCDGEDLSGIEVLSNIQDLNIYDNHVTDITALKSLSNLETLTLESEALQDYQALLEMPQIKHFYLTAKEHKDVSFIENMKQLTAVGIFNTKIKDISWLSKLDQLQELKLGYNPEIEDYSVISQLTGLKYYSVHGMKDYTNLLPLTNLETLHIEAGGALDLDYLANMKYLKELQIKSTYSDPVHISRLKEFAELEVLDISDLEISEDCSIIFDLPKLRELNMNESHLCVQMGQVQNKNQLEIIRADHVRLVSNIQSYSEGFITMVDYDELSLEDLWKILSMSPNLKELYLKKNEIQSIEPVEQFEKLNVLDITDNYVKELAPLNQLKQFETVYCADNPVADQQSLAEQIVVVSESDDD